MSFTAARYSPKHVCQLAQVRFAVTRPTYPAEFPKRLLSSASPQASPFTATPLPSRVRHFEASRIPSAQYGFARCTATFVLPCRKFSSPAVMSEPLDTRAAAPAERLTDNMERPALDNRTYRDIRLPNQLEALLIHDPDTDKVSAALDVNVGSFSDADDMPGMAHAVEHLLFMGTKKVRRWFWSGQTCKLDAARLWHTGCRGAGWDTAVCPVFRLSFPWQVFRARLATTSSC